MKNSLLYLLFILLNTALYSQDLLEQKEIELNEKLLQLRAAKTDEEMNRLNLLFKSEMATFLKIQGVFKYQFKHLKSIAIVDSPDESIRIVNWNIEYTDFSYSYCAFVLCWDSEKNVLRTTELIDNLDPYTAKPEGIIEPKNWYGALYYKILPFERNSKIEYLLMGWDGGTTGSNFKIVDVLTFNGNNLKLGSPVFKQNKTVRKRVVFEYADKSSISLRFDPKYKRIVFDHLSPESPGLVGVYSFYVPDMSYDSYSYEDEMWILKEDVIAINEEDKDKMQQIYIIGKDGNVEKKRTKNSWLSPNPDKNSSAIQHVARTPESEDVQEELQESKLPKEKRIKKKDDPNRLLITTGKYKPKKKEKERLMQLGRINRLTINRITPPGAYLEDILENEVLLPKKYLLPENEIGTEVDVFVHKDSENRIVATTETPFILLGDFRYLTVIHVNPYGAFVDWGLDKDLLVPFGEQLHSLEEGEKYLFTLRYDQATDRLFGSMKVKKLLVPCSEDLSGQEVDLLICEQSSLGLNVIVNNKYDGLIFKNNISKLLPCGTFTKGFVRTVREDGKLDIQFEPLTFEKFDQASEYLLECMKAETILYLHDRSHPDEIREKLGMSKKLFKQAVGKLYRLKKITLGDDFIRLV